MELLRLVTVKMNCRFTPSLMGEDHSTLREFTPFSIRVTSVGDEGPGTEKKYIYSG